MMSLFKSVLRIMVLVLVGIELIGCFCINSPYWGWMSIENC